MKKLYIALLIPSLALAGFSGSNTDLPPIPPPQTGNNSPVPHVISSATSSSQALSSVPSSSISLVSSSSLALPTCTKALANVTSADSLYAIGLWNEAAQQYAQRCPCVEGKLRLECSERRVRALSQDTTRLSEALQIMDSLALTIEPEQKGFAELMTTHCALLLKAGQTERALKAWRLAKQITEPALEPELKALCIQIRTQRKDTTLVTDCNKLPALSKKLSQGISSLAIHLSSSSNLSISSSSTAAVAISSATLGSYILQLGAFSSRENADLLLKNLRSRKIPARIITRNTADKVLWLVQTEPFPSREDAQAFGDKTLQPLKLDFQVLRAP